MTARAIHGRDDLLRLIAGKGGYTACNRSIEAGNVNVLGGFSPPGSTPYWCVRVWSKYGKEWFIRIYTTADGMNYTFKTVPYEPDWAYWDGDADKCSSLIEGDDPEATGERQIKALKEIVNDRETE